MIYITLKILLIIFKNHPNSRGKSKINSKKVIAIRSNSNSKNKNINKSKEEENSFLYSERKTDINNNNINNMN